MGISSRMLVSASLGAALMAGCGDKPQPASVAPKSARSGATPAVALGSGTGSNRGLRDAADLVPDDDPQAPPSTLGSSAFGAGIRPGRGASGISP